MALDCRTACDSHNEGSRSPAISKDDDDDDDNDDGDDDDNDDGDDDDDGDGDDDGAAALVSLPQDFDACVSQTTATAA
jgi:phosphopantothenoylcysteine synthetase/decarboxylase